ncbi:hypothetical protein QOT17_022804 [Balamuthia mandrillaris]
MPRPGIEPGIRVPQTRVMPTSPSGRMREILCRQRKQTERLDSSKTTVHDRTLPLLDVMPPPYPSPPHLDAPPARRYATPFEIEWLPPQRDAAPSPQNSPTRPYPGVPPHPTGCPSFWTGCCPSFSTSCCRSCIFPQMQRGIVICYLG